MGQPNPAANSERPPPVRTRPPAASRSEAPRARLPAGLLLLKMKSGRRRLSTLRRAAARLTRKLSCGVAHRCVLDLEV